MSDIYMDRQQESWDNRLDEMDYEQAQLQEHDFAQDEFWQRMNEYADKLNF